MSLSTNVSNLATRVATEIKSVRTLVNGNAANLNALTTTAKSSLVAAINELDAAIASLDLTEIINDSTTATSTTWSSTKISDAIDSAVAALVDGAPGLLDTLNELAAALGDDENFATSIATSISNAQTAAEDYADGLAVNYDAAGAAATAESNANTYTDTAIGALDTDDIEEGSGNLYYTDARVNDYLYGNYPIEYNNGSIGIAIKSNGGLTADEAGILVNRVIVNTWYDAAGSAESAQAAAEDYADGLAVNYEVAGAAAAAESAANLYTDGEISTLQTAIGDTNANYVTTFEAGLV